ncbi:dihydroorotate dehydrogenase electron transfer subunit [Candidatus Epulonipiscium viviparus]|uniref:dihydroorotate dehydrogenase electron transfer subunit n=1 Tax=Candidatus Epulonipiscium viviparus TaxID=420336 RepID=UPI0027380D6A|nr:dihydroorotate dehydrogenase electron transfer subunit [Candidatus Epulopiscium viviparus]
MAKIIKDVTIIENTLIATDVYKMVLDDLQIAQTADVGRFINLYPKNASTLLPRPISISEISDTTITIVYHVVGCGTAEFSKLKAGDAIRISSALGHGYTIADAKTHILIGGGIGVPPLVELAKRITSNKIAILGYQDEPILVDKFQEAGATVYVATETGSVGFKGNVIDLITSEGILGDYYYACGPKPMLKAVKMHCKDINKPVQLSLEERMGCGYGACVGCVSKINNELLKICVDGPVFLGNEVNF